MYLILDCFFYYFKIYLCFLLPISIFSSFKSLIELMLKHFLSLNFSLISSSVSFLLCATFWMNSMTWSFHLLIYSSVISILLSQPICEDFVFLTPYISNFYYLQYWLIFTIQIYLTYSCSSVY